MISRYLAQGYELVIDSSECKAYIFLSPVRQLEINFDLGVELAGNLAFKMDSANFETGIETFVIDYETMRDEGIRGNNLGKQVNAILRKYDVAYSTLTLKDLLR
jgi:hypothetical protein